MAKSDLQVLIIMGSASDREVMSRCRQVLEDFSVRCEMTVASAHRSPERALKLAREAEGRGVKVLVAGAGMAAHLAGIIAAHTSLPVIGVPLASAPFQGFDSLLSTVQMPPGVPVATMAVGSAGAQNAAHLAVRILALSDSKLSKKLKDHAKKLARDVEKAALEMGG